MIESKMIESKVSRQQICFGSVIDELLGYVNGDEKVISWGLSYVRVFACPIRMTRMRCILSPTHSGFSTPHVVLTVLLYRRACVLLRIDISLSLRLVTGFCSWSTPRDFRTISPQAQVRGVRSVRRIDGINKEIQFCSPYQMPMRMAQRSTIQR